MSRPLASCPVAAAAIAAPWPGGGVILPKGRAREAQGAYRTGQMDIKGDLLRTKFYMPAARVNMVERSRLRRQLEEGLCLGHPLTLVSAPAGYGKTTLIAAWLRQRDKEPPGLPVHIAWVSMDDDDNDPARFFAYVIAAIQEAGIDWRPLNQTLWDISASLPVETIITSLLNETGRLEEQRPLILVLDDYHKIRSAIIHDALQFTLDYAPPGLRIILITREDPPLTLARLRAREQLTEIRAADLRFTLDEAAGFLNRTMALDLPVDQLAALEHRTEGWIAGLQLAALALRSLRPGDAQTGEEFIASFSGDHHYIIDYLLEEVLRQQDESVRAFLRQTAALDRLCAPLCDAVTGRDDSRTMLMQLERANLFLIPLDDRREWYRYHHLMADSLRAGLDKSTLDATHRRASQWYEAHNLAGEAVHHAFAAGDPVLAADVLERVIQEASAWSRGEVSRLTGWLDSLPDSVLPSRPALSLHASRALYLSGQMERAEALLRQAELSLRGDTSDSCKQPGLPALAVILRAAMDTMRGENLAEAAVAMRRLLAQPEFMGNHAAARAADTLGLACELSGDVGAAEEAYLRASELAQAAGVSYLAVNAHCEAALMQIQQGRLSLAAETCRTALGLAGDKSAPPMGLAWAILGDIARERNDPAAAEQLILTGIELSHEGGIVDDLRYAYLYLARLRQAQGEPAAALAAWQKADSLMRSYKVPRLTMLSTAHRAQLDLSQGNLALAGQWAQQYQQVRVSRPVEYLREFEDLMLARVLLAGQKYDETLELLQPLLATAQAAGHNRTVIEALILQVLTQQTRVTEIADASLITALSLAAPEGFARLFIDAGPALIPSLIRVRDATPTYVDQLLAALSTGNAIGDQSVTASPSSQSPSSQTEEPLSEREIEVLRLLAAGLSNQEIADELFISAGTVKWYAHNIYGKLGARGRTQAVARARERRLI